MITSRNNAKIKQVRALRQLKARRESRLFLVEGIRHVGEAVEAGASLDSIIYSPKRLESKFGLQLVERQEKRGIPCIAVSGEIFDGLVERENPQGILAVVRQPLHLMRDYSPDNLPWGVALVASQDPGNLGAILRTMDAVGANGLLLLDASVDPYHPSAVRASMGTLFWHPVINTTFAEFSSWARQYEYHIYGTSAHGSTDYQQVGGYKFPRILLMGSEREGLSPEQAAVCEILIRLPMRGHATSLNLAVATGVMLYAMLGVSD